MSDHIEGTLSQTQPMRDVSLTQLRYFLRAAEQSSMTRAAQDLYVAQSAISAAIAHLERELGTALFIRRHARGLVLTSAGRTLLVSARSILNALAASLEEVAEEAQVTRGTLHAACFTPIVPFYLPAVLARLSLHHPGVELQLTEGLLPDVGAAIESGRAEIALTYERGLTERVHREVLTRIRPYAAVSENHPLAGRAAVSLRDLADFPMTLMDLPDSREYFLQLFADEGIDVTVQYRSSSYEAVRSLVARTDGFALLHQRPATEATYAGGRIVSLPITDDVEPLPVVLAWRREMVLSARARAFAEHARAVVTA